MNGSDTFYAFTHSALQYRKRMTIISLVTSPRTQHATDQRKKYLRGHLWCELRSKEVVIDWGSWKCQRYIWCQSKTAAALNAESGGECAPIALRALFAAEGIFHSRQKKTLHQTCCDTNGANIPILVSPHPHLLACGPLGRLRTFNSPREENALILEGLSWSSVRSVTNVGLDMKQQIRKTTTLTRE